MRAEQVALAEGSRAESARSRRREERRRGTGGPGRGVVGHVVPLADCEASVDGPELRRMGASSTYV